MLNPMMDDVWDATVAVYEWRRGKGKKLYNDYAPEEAIAISSKGEDDFEMGKRPRSNHPPQQP